MTCSSSMSGGPEYCRRIAREKRFSYRGTAEVRMPQNYIAFFRTQGESENREKIQQTIPVVEALAGYIREGRTFPDSGMKRWEFISSKMVIGLFYQLLVKTKAFSATAACVGCGRCAAVCPLGNIKLRDGKPVWSSNCTHCMACINLCPREAIEYGKRTSGKPRYKGPENYISSGGAVR